jgi:signal transduction histidine kinase
MIDLLTVRVRYEQDIVSARQRARQIGALAGFDAQHQARIATAVSEIARNAFRYAGGGWVEFALDEESAPQVLSICVRDEGPGIAELDAIRAGQYRSQTGMGLGIVGAQRLMDECHIESAPGKGTRVWLRKQLPQTSPRPDRAQAANLAAALAQKAPQSAFEELQVQNQELMRALDELRQRQDELVHLNRELEDTNRGVVALYAELDEKAEHLRRADETKSRFLSNMSHEFRTPLYSALALTQLLLEGSDGDLNAEQQKQVRFIRKGAEHLLEMVNDLLDIAKIEAGKIEVRIAAFEVGTMFSALRGMLRPLLTSDSVTLAFDEPQGLPALHTDEGKVAQILRNFISNGLKFTEHGEVRVTAQLDADADKVVFAVSDSGIGIAPADQDRIFEEFTQIEHPLQKRTNGTGLGLPLTRRLAALLGGSVNVSSEPGKGSTFRALIPIHYRSQLTEAQGSHARSRTPQADAHEQGAALPQPLERALVVDDDAAARYLLKRWLDPQRWEIHEADDGEAALASARRLRPGVIFLDIGMPRLSGDEALRRLRADPATQDIPVIMVTSRALSAAQRESLASLGAAVVSKEELTGPRIGEILREALRMEQIPP